MHINELSDSYNIPLFDQPKEITRSIFLNLKGNELGPLISSSKKISQMVKDVELWALLFKKDFPYASLRYKQSTYEDYKAKFLIEKNWNEGLYLEKTPSRIIRAFKLAVFQNFIFSSNGHSSFEIYHKHNLNLISSCPQEDVCSFHENGQYIIAYRNEGPTGGVDITIREKESGKFISKIKDCLRFHIDEAKIFGILANYSLHPMSIVVWDKFSGALLHTFDTTEQATRKMVLDSNYFFLGMRNGTIKAWFKSDYSLMGTFVCEKNNDEIYALLDADPLLVSGHANGYVRFWDKQEKKMIFELQDNSEPTLETITDLKRASGHLFCKHDSYLKVWKEQNKTVAYTVKDCSEYYLFNDDRILCTVLKTNEIEGRDSLTGRFLFLLKGFENQIIQKLFIDDSRLFAKVRSKNWDANSLEIWDLTSLSKIKSLPGCNDFEVDGDRLIVSYGDDGIKVLDFSLTSEVKLHALQVPSDPSLLLSF